MEFLLFHTYFVVAFGSIIDLIILIANFYILFQFLKNSTNLCRLAKFFNLNRVQAVNINQAGTSSSLRDGSIFSKEKLSISITTASTATNAFLISLCFSSK